MSASPAHSGASGALADDRPKHLRRALPITGDANRRGVGNARRRPRTSSPRRGSRTGSSDSSRPRADSSAAAAGGVTTIIVMPDTKPVIDQVALVDFIQRRARDNAVVHVHVMAAMTRGLKGQLDRAKQNTGCCCCW